MNLNLARVCLVLLFVWPMFRVPYMYKAMNIHENRQQREEKYRESQQFTNNLLHGLEKKDAERQKLAVDMHVHLSAETEKKYKTDKQYIDEAYQSVIFDSRYIVLLILIPLLLTFFKSFITDRFFGFLVMATLVFFPVLFILDVLLLTNNAFSYIVARGLYVQPSVPMILLDVGIYVGLMGVYLYQIARAGGFSVRDRLLRGEYGRLR